MALTALGKAGSTLVLPGPVDLTLVFNYSNAFGLVPVSGELTRWGARGALVHYVPLGSPSSSLEHWSHRKRPRRYSIGAVIGLFNASKLGFIWLTRRQFPRRSLTLPMFQLILG